MVDQGASPGVQDAEQTKFAAQIPGIGPQSQQGLGRRAHQQRQQIFLVGADHLPPRLRQGENHVEVGNGKEIVFAFGEPASGAGTAALGATAVVTGVVGVVPVAARITGEEPSAKRCGATVSNIAQGTAMAG